MPELAPPALIVNNIIYSGCTLYMIAILLRWLGPWLNIEFHARPWKWIPPVTDPLLESIRKILPVMGPMDWSPVAALAGLWILRLLFVGR